MNRSFACFLLLLLLAGGALAFRIPQLGDRPMHHDEAVQAEIFRRLWQQGQYQYDPDEFHGPTLPYATEAAVAVLGPTDYSEMTEGTFRLVPVLFGVGSLLLLGLLAKIVGWPAALLAAVLLAVSPATVFYNRYFIHETLFTFFTLAAIVAAARYWHSRRVGWSILTGACLGLMQATKETSVLVFLAMACGVGGVWIVERLVFRNPEHSWRRVLWPHVVAGLFAAVIVAIVFLSSFGANPRGPVDGLLTYLPWANRAGGASPHLQAWYYFLKLLAWCPCQAGGSSVGSQVVLTESLVLILALLGGIFAWTPKRWLPKRLRADAESWSEVLFDTKPIESDRDCETNPGSAIRHSACFAQWLSIYAVVLVVIYSAIPYKTPWCVLGPLQGLILLAAVGGIAMVAAMPHVAMRVALTVALIGGVYNLGRQSYLVNYELQTAAANPYVHTPTQPDVRRLVDQLDQLAAASKDGYAMTVKLIWRDSYYWPLPWYLRRFEQTQRWSKLPQDVAAPIVICSPEHDVALTERLDDTHLMIGYYSIRPNVFALLWVRMDVWEAHLKRLGRL